MHRLSSLSLSGFKSIRELKDLEFRKLNVLIGANGAGKSNLISFFRMLSWMTAGMGNLQIFIGKSGGASNLLFESTARTREIMATLTLQTKMGVNEYCMRLVNAAPDTLIFAEEKYRFSKKDYGPAQWIAPPGGQRETSLIEQAASRSSKSNTATAILGMFRRCNVFQFHNTSETARIRQSWDVTDHLYLKEDGANLAAFLFRLRQDRFPYYRRIIDHIRLIYPQLDDFVLEPDWNQVMLRWRERGSDVIFGPHQASDGTLRVMMLMTLLLQPEDQQPPVIILDEPELGLHPYAIHCLAEILQSLPESVQVLLATQSATLIDYFEPEDIIVVSRNDRESQFSRLDAQQLQEWLDEYSLSELWEKNVLGGRP